MKYLPKIRYIIFVFGVLIFIYIIFRKIPDSISLGIVSFDLTKKLESADLVDFTSYTVPFIYNEMTDNKIDNNSADVRVVIKNTSNKIIKDLITSIDFQNEYLIVSKKQITNAPDCQIYFPGNENIPNDIYLNFSNGSTTHMSFDNNSIASIETIKCSSLPPKSTLEFSFRSENQDFFLNRNKEFVLKDNSPKYIDIMYSYYVNNQDTSYSKRIQVQ